MFVLALISANITISAISDVSAISDISAVIAISAGHTFDHACISAISANSADDDNEHAIIMTAIIALISAIRVLAMTLKFPPLTG